MATVVSAFVHIVTKQIASPTLVSKPMSHLSPPTMRPAMTTKRLCGPAGHPKGRSGQPGRAWPGNAGAVPARGKVAMCPEGRGKQWVRATRSRAFARFFRKIDSAALIYIKAAACLCRRESCTHPPLLSKQKSGGSDTGGGLSFTARDVQIFRGGYPLNYTYLF